MTNWVNDARDFDRALEALENASAALVGGFGSTKEFYEAQARVTALHNALREELERVRKLLDIRTDNVDADFDSAVDEYGERCVANHTEDREYWELRQAARDKVDAIYAALRERLAEVERERDALENDTAG